MTKNSKLLLAFYGDDFTGSTDALEFLSRAGVKTVLFIEPPTREQLSRYEDLGAIGIAGTSRSMAPEEMEKELRPAFSALLKAGARHVHYKVCSTFDSSPEIGSIGKAIDIGAEVFSAPFIPVLVGAPKLGRYCVFGNLFARMGIGSKGNIYRLDRHPSMSGHPVTPADESDLRLHLSRQTAKNIGLMDILEIIKSPAEAEKYIKKLLHQEFEIILFDALYDEQMAGIGAILESFAFGENQPLFTVGSSGIEMALGDFWKKEGLLQPMHSWTNPGNVGPVLIASGSRSPVTAEQISWAVSKGFAEVALDTAAIASETNQAHVIEKHVSEVKTKIQEGRSVILHTSCSADDERVKRTKEVFASRGLDQEMIRARTAPLYGSALGEIIRAVAGETSLNRVVVAGGDTSSFAVRAMGIEAVEMIAPLSPGAPLCRAYAPGSSVDGLEVNFKGGQVGNDNYFGMVEDGKFVS